MADRNDSVLVLGWGNPLRGDDGVSARVLDALRNTPGDEEVRLELKQVHQLAPELSETVARFRGVVFVDARAGGTPGEVRCEDVAPGEGRTTLSHSLSPEALLLYAERLYGHAPAAAVVTISGRSFDHGTDLCPEASQAVPKAARKVRGLARLWAHEPLLPKPASA